MKNIVLKGLLCLVTSLVLAGCVDLDPRGRGPFGIPPQPEAGQNGGDDDGDDDDHHHGQRHKD